MTQPLSASQALAIVDNCPFPLLLLDISGEVTGYNRAFEQLLGHLRSCDRHAPGTSPLRDESLQRLVEAQGTVSWSEHDGNQCHFEIVCFALPEHGDTQVRIFVDVSRRVWLEQAHNSLGEELKQHALTDSLTGLLNRRGLMLALEPQVARSRRYNSAMAVIMFSIDHDGHQQSLPLEVARLLKDQLRWADLTGCTEQQEFILALPETTAEAALKLVDKLEPRLNELATHARFCFGVTGWRKSDDASKLLKRAAQSLARAHAERTLHFVAS